MDHIKNYEAMAKLDLEETERMKLSAWADMLTASFDALDRIDTHGAEPMYTVLDIHNVLREDVSTKMITRDELLANAPMAYDGYFQVPKTL